MQMDSIQNIVYYCCVAKGNRVLYTYDAGDQEIEALVAVFLERTPPFHIWYFKTVGQRTYGFLMEDGYVYFTIVDEVLGNARVLRLLEHVKDGFKKVVKNGSRSNLASSNPICIEEQLRMVLAIDAVICLVLFGIWLRIFHDFQCIR
ncbi:phytolongin Phyl1.1-like [Magnolia sinica]|uniref:phytolongin Phyl1.1-like n=1 Tax=Magnolia sinica TaxID=86752 RepID=UPI00265AC519|nr:phytolongin Phyl1.1-like [Magnolia sinica]